MQGSYAEAYTLRGALAKRCGTRRRVQGLLHGLRLDSIAEEAVFSLHQGVRLVYRDRETNIYYRMPYSSCCGQQRTPCQSTMSNLDQIHKYGPFLSFSLCLEA